MFRLRGPPCSGQYVAVPPGVGKSHLSKALGREAIGQGTRYERGSIMVASNRSVGEWGEVFGDAVVATAILDRVRRLAFLTSFARPI